MSTIKNMLDRVKRLDLRAEVPVIVENTEEQVLDLNREQLLLHGTDSEGKLLQEYRSAAYARKKNRQNPNPGYGNPDLHLTGYFHSTFALKDITPKTFRITATDSITGKLTEKYGENIFGLSKDSTRRYAMGPFFSQVKLYIETVSGLKFK